tara:strand:- start:4355 stop:5587 length:1233 start_codon:yes stop_codon:yes gene_type:complete
MDNIEVDAEYMNRWLGGNDISDMSPKVMYDVQQLIKHYRNIIVPDTTVDVVFPVSGTPCANISENKVMIPCNLLLNGQVDDTIGAMIHELHHIKWTDAPKEYMYAVWLFFKKTTKSITLDNGQSMFDAVFVEQDVSFNNIINLHEVENPSPNLQFVGECFGEIHLLVNALEDVRIDGNTPKNMKKYIDKGDAKAYVGYEKAIEEGKLDEIDIYSLPYHLLFHHKGFCTNEFVSKTMNDTKFILANPPSVLVVDMLDKYGKLISQHIKDKFQDGGMQSKGTSIDDLDSYLGDMMLGDVDSSIDEEAVKNLSPEQQKEIAEAIANLNIPQSDINDEEFSIPEYSNSTTKVSIGHTKSTLQFHQEQQIIKKNKLISAELDASIKSFANLQVYTTTEDFGRKVTYDTVIFDATR